MNLRRFGTTDLMVSPLCFGTMRFASKSGDEDAVSANGRRALEEAIDRGVNFVHSSYEYGTRWLTGSVLERHPKRHELLHIIKVNTPDWGEPAFDPRAFRQQVEHALRELHTDRIAVVQHLQRGAVPNHLGYCSDGEPERLSAFDTVIEPLLEVFTELREEGKVGYLTSFPYTAGYARRAQESGAFSGIVAFYNLIETEMRDLFDAMQAKGQGFIGIRGLMGGLLSDARVDRSRLAAGDRFADTVWDRAYEQLDALRATVGSVPSWTELATRFAVADPRIASTVVGINSPEQLRDVLSALDATDSLTEVTSKAHALCTAFRERYGVKANPSGIPVR